MRLPSALLLDLDDTILNDTGCVHSAWKEACRACAPECGIPPEYLHHAIQRSSAWFWSDADRHRIGRLDLIVARVEVARLALKDLGVESADLARKLGSIYHERRDQGIEIFPDAVDTLVWARDHGCRLALLTNGAAAPQRRKIEQFGLKSYFDAVFIEGELGFGKPDERVYRLALDAVAVDPPDAWMVGDNLEWDVAQPQRLGIAGIWIDAGGKGHRHLESVKPAHVIRRLADLRGLASVPS